MIVEQEAIYDEVANSLSKVIDGHCILGCNNKYLDALVMILEEAMRDEYSYIGWWLWEAPAENKTVELGDGTRYDLKEPEALYDFLEQFREV